MAKIKQPPKQTSHPVPPKQTKFTDDKGSKQYGKQASGPLPADPGKGK